MSTQPAANPFMPPGVPSPPNTGNEQIGPGAPSPFLHEEKPLYPLRGQDSHASSFFAFAEPVLGPFNKVLDKIQEKRRALNLPFPGTAEHLQKETKQTLLSNFFYDGARADMVKTLSVNPIFQVTHAFSMGATSAQGPVPPSYNFGAVYGNDRVFMQAGLDDSMSVTMRANTRLAPGHISKVQAQLAAVEGASFVQLEQDYQGLDNAANIKALNPSPTDGAGIYVANYIQSLTRNFALGVETIYQRQSAEAQESMMGYLAKWTSDSRDAIATAQWQAQGMLGCTYWQRLSDRVEAAADLQVITAAGKREAQATVGAKYDFRMSTFRAQLDSSGKIASQLETRLAQAFAFTVGGEIDHLRSQAKFGLGISLESSPSELLMDPNSPPPPPPSVPM